MIHSHTYTLIFTAAPAESPSHSLPPCLGDGSGRWHLFRSAGYPDLLVGAPRGAVDHRNEEEMTLITLWPPPWAASLSVNAVAERYLRCRKGTENRLQYGRWMQTNFAWKQRLGELECRQGSATTLLTKDNTHKTVELSVISPSRKKRKNKKRKIKHLLIDFGISEAALIIRFCYRHWWNTQKQLLIWLPDSFSKADPFHYSWYQSLSQFQVPHLAKQLVLITGPHMEIDWSGSM